MKLKYLTVNLCDTPTWEFYSQVSGKKISIIRSLSRREIKVSKERRNKRSWGDRMTKNIIPVYIYAHVKINYYYHPYFFRFKAKEEN